MTVVADRQAYQALYDALPTRYVQCRCGRAQDGRIGLAGLRRAGWTFELGVSRLRWRCPDCSPGGVR
ncbi:MAG TPA: hypothetical protein VK540_31670 [Polyangiaceae bacterium]|nr:hypothetical protein [Polyangiaceae bacterium]